MAQTPHLSVGAGLYISAVSPTTFDAAGFAALTWTEIGGLSKGPENIGDSFNTTEFKYLKTGLTAVLKGSRKANSWDIEMATMEDDVGQVKLASANNGANKALEHSFKLVEGNGAVTYWKALVAGFTKSVGDADTVAMRKCTIAVVSEQIEVAPA
jgi:hypothetical protein